ncbi:MAG: hypothetical protein WC637_01330 [Victivallales bacterium]
MVQASRLFLLLLEEQVRRLYYIKEDATKDCGVLYSFGVLAAQVDVKEFQSLMNSYFLNSEIHLLRIAKFALGGAVPWYRLSSDKLACQLDEEQAPLEKAVTSYSSKVRPKRLT